MQHLLERLPLGPQNRQRVTFLAVGGVNLAIFTVTFVVLHALLAGVVGYMVVLVASYALSVLCAFWLHRRLTFQVEGQVLVDLLRFSTVQLASLGLNAVALPLLVEVVGLPVVPAQLIALVLVVVSNYFGHLLFSFRRPVGLEQPSR